MSTMDDFNRALFDRAEGKYKRAQFEAITIDEWCALVEGHRTQSEDNAENAAMVDKLTDQVKKLEAQLDALRYPND